MYVCMYVCIKLAFLRAAAVCVCVWRPVAVASWAARLQACQRALLEMRWASGSGRKEAEGCTVAKPEGKRRG
jgi:hypothetical protein